MDRVMNMRRIAAILALLAVLVLADSAGAGGVPPIPKLGGTWSHAEINVTIGKKQHTLVLDRGVVRKASPSQLTVQERGGVAVVIPLAKRAIVTIDGARATLYAISSGMTAETMRIDGGAAVRVRAVS